MMYFFYAGKLMNEPNERTRTVLHPQLRQDVDDFIELYVLADKFFIPKLREYTCPKIFEALDRVRGGRWGHRSGMRDCDHGPIVEVISTLNQLLTQPLADQGYLKEHARRYAWCGEAEA